MQNLQYPLTSTYHWILGIRHVFAGSVFKKIDLLFIFADEGVGGGHKTVIFHGRNKCMTPNRKF